MYDFTAADTDCSKSRLFNPIKLLWRAELNCAILEKYVIIKNREITEEMKIGFDNEKYLTMQSEHIKQRIGEFGDKLYLEFGGKLFDDYHASRVLPGFEPDSKLRMLLQMADQLSLIHI